MICIKFLLTYKVVGNKTVTVRFKQKLNLEIRAITTMMMIFKATNRIKKIFTLLLGKQAFSIE